MRWFEASPRRAAPKGPVLHLPRSTASRSSAYIKLLSTFVTHIFVDQTSEQAGTSDLFWWWSGEVFGPLGRSLVECAVGAMGVVVPEVGHQDCG